mmetsp:Transcript_11086/g.25701  ORF Transcript_11086/g.25701 Transcript_11086/m.25701 type:complete len:183 (+) Transcript_11086:1518-2066(+)
MQATPIPTDFPTLKPTTEIPTLSPTHLMPAPPIGQGTEWIQVASDIDGPVAGDFAGSCVDLSSDGLAVVVGFSGYDSPIADAGLLRIYTFQTSSWVQLGNDITVTTEPKNIGGSCKLSDTGRAVITYSDIIGEARVFIFDDATASWTQRGQVLVGTPGDGRNVVDISGDGIWEWKHGNSPRL